MISTFMVDRTIIPLYKSGTTISSAQSTYVSYVGANRVGIYLQIQKLTQYDKETSIGQLP